MATPVPADYWTFFASEAERGHSPLYKQLALGIREDDRLRAMAARVKPGQPQANIILGAVHYMLLNGTDHPLADHYKSVRPAAIPKGEVFAAFRDFCFAHEAALVAVIESRVTNTNEVARSTSLYPAFDFVAAEARDSLRLVEIGPSAGFNLNWDRYRYTYRLGEKTLTRGPATARLNLTAPVRGTRLPNLAAKFPVVESRVGLELNPVDLHSAADRLWLKALIWPELTPRFARLDAALGTALAYPQRIVVGDALDNLEPTVKALPADGIVVVYHSHVTYQFSNEMRDRLNAILEQLSHARPLYRISIEWDGGAYPINIGRYENGTSTKRTIALCDPHGSWLEWTATP
ncbi:MAG: DUF2332 domain-containing protein [Alphaproteobacteria bacterium]|nr:DUF2332 domain-containing protein [Alphaproteobacteria bacterium]